MFVFNAKLNRRRAVILVLLLAVLLCIVILTAGARSEKAAGAFDTAVTDNASRIKFLESLGWQVEPEPIDEQSVIIPQEFSAVYEEYNELQLTQGLDLRKYGGCEATRYSYSVTNYPEDGRVIADMIVYRGRVIAGDIQSAALDGFMHGLEYPE